MKDQNDLADYISTLVEKQGIAVVTVNDGWVMTITKDRLQQLLAAAEDKDKIILFIKSSAKLPIN